MGTQRPMAFMVLFFRRRQPHLPLDGAKRTAVCGPNAGTTVFSSAALPDANARRVITDICDLATFASYTCWSRSDPNTLPRGSRIAVTAPRPELWRGARRGKDPRRRAGSLLFPRAS